MLKKLLVVFVLGFVIISCQFTETMTLNEDGTGHMSIKMDMSEMLAFGVGPETDSLGMDQDTTFVFRELFEAKRDSISKLPAEEQAALKKLENYSLHMLVNTEESKMIIDMFSDFKDISETNELFSGFSESSSFMPSIDGTSPTKSKEAPNMAVKYSYANSVFTRDAYIVDEAVHAKQKDSLEQMAQFMEKTMYKVVYTFPKRIKSTNLDDAKISEDGKTIEFERSFMDYIKNPDVLDVEVVLKD